MDFREKPHTDKYKWITNDSNNVVISTSPSDWDFEYFDRFSLHSVCIIHADLTATRHAVHFFTASEAENIDR
jgi:hypothetical protein